MHANFSILPLLVAIPLMSASAIAVEIPTTSSASQSQFSIRTQAGDDRDSKDCTQRGCGRRDRYNFNRGSGRVTF